MRVRVMARFRLGSPHYECVTLIGSFTAPCRDSLLVVADSFSDMSEVEVKGNKYRTTLLLDNLNGVQCLCADDSRWYRVNIPKLKYPVDLQNVHYFLRVYRKI